MQKLFIAVTGRDSLWELEWEYRQSYKRGRKNHTGSGLLIGASRMLESCEKKEQDIYVEYNSEKNCIIHTGASGI